MTLDQTIVENQLGHIADHEQIASLLNAAPATYVEAGSQVFDVKDYGAVMNGTADDTTALTDCVAAANAVAGTVFLPPGTLKFTGSHTLGTNTKLRGSGNMTSFLKAGDATACLVVGSGVTRTYTSVEHITLDGNNLSPMMLSVNMAFQSTFYAIRVRNTAAGGEAVRNDGTQNCLFTKLSITDFAGDGLRVYDKTAGDVYLGMRIGTPTSTTSRHLVMDTDVGGSVPNNHLFIGGHIEGPYSNETRVNGVITVPATEFQSTMVLLGDCANIYFNKVQINGDAENTNALHLVDIDKSAKRIFFNECTLQGGSGTTGTIAIYMMDTLTSLDTAFKSGFTGRMRFQDLAAIVRIDDGGHDWEFMGPLNRGSIGDNIAALSVDGAVGNVYNRQLAPLVLESHTAGENILVGKNANGDTVFTVDDTGAIVGTPVGAFLTPAVAVADLTVTNSATPENFLTVTGLISGQKYLVRATLFYTNGTTSADSAIGWNIPGGGSTIQWTPGALGSSVGTSAGNYERQLRTTVPGFALGGPAATALVAEPVAVVNCLANGSLVLQFAQNVAEPGISSVALTGSTMTVQRIT